MITKEQAKELVEDYARDFEKMPYTELERIVDTEDGLPEARKIDHDGTEVTLCANLTQYGLKSHVAVEVFVDADYMDKWGWRPCYYFEMFPSGEIKRFDKFGAAEVFLCIFIGVGLVSCVYYLAQAVRWAF